MEIWQGFLWGIFGGVLPEILVLYKRRYENTPEFIKRPFYILVSLAMTLIGGGFVVLYLKSGVNLNPILSVHIGASTPLLIATIKSKMPDLEPGTID